METKFIASSSLVEAVLRGADEWNARVNTGQKPPGIAGRFAA
jgi:hypothetical protein